jgi:hypothetical protein
MVLPIDKGKAEAQFEKLIQLLVGVGLAVGVRDGDDCSLLVFTKIASERRLLGEVYRSRSVPMHELIAQSRAFHNSRLAESRTGCTAFV